LLFAILAIMVAVLFVFVSCGDEETTSTPATESVPTTESTPATQSTPATESTPTTQSTPASESTPATDTTPAESTETAPVESTESTPAESTDTTPAESTRPEPKFSSRDTSNKKWEGQTLNVLTVRYAATAAGPWTQMELNPEVWGISMVQAQENRTAKINELYGVTINWTDALGPQSLINDLNTALTSSDTSYEIAYPRAFELFSLANGLVYDMNNREYIDFNNTYFSEDAYKAFTLAGHTFFADGEFNFMNEELSYFLLYNKDMLKNELGIDSLYNEVKNGTWTYDKFASLARAVYKDNGNGEPDDLDTYGFGTKDFKRLYRHFGVYGVKVNEDSEVYEVTENANMTRLNKVIEKIIELKTNATWARDSWGGDWGNNCDIGFADGRILFYTDVSEKTNEMSSHEFSMGVLPFPKLDAEQERYYTAMPGGAQPIFMCIPITTADREMSDFFIDVLSWTGEDYVTPAYIEHKMPAFDMETADEDLEILQNYIWNNIMYDVASQCYGWSTFFGNVESEAVDKGVNNFNQAFQERIEDVLDMLEFINGYWTEYED